MRHRFLLYFPTLFPIPITAVSAVALPELMGTATDTGVYVSGF
jgi:hypothetical protein